MQQHRLLIATDIPFWRKSTGAEQRICSLVKYLTSESIVVRTFYLGQSESAFNDSDRELIRENSLDVRQKSSDQPPKNFARKIGWYVDATINQINPVKRINTSNEGKAESSSNKPLELDDFRWPWAITAFADEINEFQPNSILVEYVKLGYLLESLSPQQRNATICLIDTHDVLHLRCEQFHERGFPHWIQINRQEESDVLDEFDIVVAIQSEEAKLFEEMAPHAKVIICGHAIDSTIPLPNHGKAKTGDNQTLSMGYLGSTNWSNTQAVENFLDSVWKPLTLENQIGFELVIAGNICEIVKAKIESSQLPNIRMIGRVENLKEFYDQVDIVINPVEFGTGLKIKNVEALIMGKPVLTTPSGSVGMPECTSVVTCNSSSQFLREIQIFLTNPQRLSEFTKAARELSKTAFSDQQAYSALKKCLLQGK